MLREELAHIGVLPADPLADQVVQVTHHLAIGGKVFRRHRSDGVAHALDELVEDLLAQALDQRVEALPYIGLEEVVLAQVADPVAEVGWQPVELVDATRREIACGAGRHLVRRVCRSVLEPPFDARPLVRDDLFELAPDVTEHVAEVVALAQVVASAGQSIHEVLEAGQVRSGRVAAAPTALHQPAERFGQVALRHEVVGQGLEDLVGVEVGQALGAVPTRVAGATGELRRRIVGAGDAAGEVARVGRVGGHREDAVIARTRSRTNDHR